MFTTKFLALWDKNAFHVTKNSTETKLLFALHYFQHCETNCASPHIIFVTLRQNWDSPHQSFGTENKIVNLTTKFSTLCDKVVISAKQIFSVFGTLKNLYALEGWVFVKLILDVVSISYSVFLMAYSKL